MKTVTLSSKNQIVIPSHVRKQLGISSGNKLIIQRVTESEVVLKKEPSFKDLIGSLPKSDSNPVERVRKIRNGWE